MTELASWMLGPRSEHHRRNWTGGPDHAVPARCCCGWSSPPVTDLLDVRNRWLHHAVEEPNRLAEGPCTQPDRPAMTEPPVDWQAEATRWRAAYLALIEHAMDTAVKLEQARAGKDIT